MDPMEFEKPRYVDDRSRCNFYHTIDLPEVGTIEGGWDLRGRFDEYIGGVDVAGRKVLDVGTATGFLSFESEKRGADVVSFDIGSGENQTLLPFEKSEFYTNHAAWVEDRTWNFEFWKNAYWYCHRLLKSKARVYYGDVYHIPVELGCFDVTVVGAILMHLSDPVSALASIARVTGDVMVVVDGMLDTDDPVARLMGRASSPENDSSWWTLSRGVYREVLGMLGFEIDKITRESYLLARPNSLVEPNTWGELTSIVAVRTGRPVRYSVDLPSIAGLQA
jgi:SAM-dependent methyltransferase